MFLRHSHLWVRCRLITQNPRWKTQYNITQQEMLSVRWRIESWRIASLIYRTETQTEQVVKVIWHKTASPLQTDGSIVFARWRQCAFPYGHNCRHLANMIELVLPSVNPSQQSKWQINPFSRSCTAHGRKSIYLQWAVLPKKLPLATADLDLI